MAPPERLNLPAHFEIEPALREQLSNRAGHQRCMEGFGELLLVLHEVPKAGVPEREAWFFWKRSDGRWTQAGGPGINQLSELLSRYEATIDGYEELLEKDGRASQLFAIVRHAAPITRSLRNLVAALEQALNHEPDDRDIRSLRDRAREIERAADLLHSDVKTTLEFRVLEHHEKQSEVGERIGRIAHRLNLVVGFFLPLAALVGIFGMNVKMPGFVQPLFWGILICGLLGAGALFWLLGRDSPKDAAPLSLSERAHGLRHLSVQLRDKLKR